MLFDVTAATITPVDASLHSEAEQPVGYSQTFLALYLQSGGCNNPPGRVERHARDCWIYNFCARLSSNDRHSSRLWELP